MKDWLLLFRDVTPGGWLAAVAGVVVAAFLCALFVSIGRDIARHRRLSRMAEEQRRERGVCRVCGCTDDDCMQCIRKTGEPCRWVDESHTLCSACTGKEALD